MASEIGFYRRGASRGERNMGAVYWQRRFPAVPSVYSAKDELQSTTFGRARRGLRSSTRAAGSRSITLPPGSKTTSSSIRSTTPQTRRWTSTLRLTSGTRSRERPSGRGTTSPVSSWRPRWPTSRSERSTRLCWHHKSAPTASSPPGRPRKMLGCTLSSGPVATKEREGRSKRRPRRLCSGDYKTWTADASTTTSNFGSRCR